MQLRPQNPTLALCVDCLVLAMLGGVMAFVMICCESR